MFYKYANFSDINVTAMAMKATLLQMIKWAFLPILGARFGAKRPGMGHNAPLRYEGICLYIQLSY